MVVHKSKRKVHQRIGKNEYHVVGKVNTGKLDTMNMKMRNTPIGGQQIQLMCHIASQQMG